MSGGRLRLFLTHENGLFPTIRLSKASNLAVDGDCCGSHGVPPKYMFKSYCLESGSMT